MTIVTTLNLKDNANIQYNRSLIDTSRDGNRYIFSLGPSANNALD